MKSTPDQFDFNSNSRSEIWKYLIRELEQHYDNPKSVKTSPKLDLQEIKSFVSRFDFSEPLEGPEAIQHVVEGLKDFIVHTTHPSYYGLFNPRASFPGILSDVITAVFNPQMAAWSHAPFATEAENYCIRELGKKFGYEEATIDGTFCSGGAEANLTAVLSALCNKFPDYLKVGLRDIPQQPVLYCSNEAHHSIARAARVAGLGIEKLRAIPTDAKQQMDVTLLEHEILKDKEKGLTPFMVIANGGSTGTGAIDPITEIAWICTTNHLWFHLDAAYGGAVIVNDAQKELMEGAQLADSITIDIHKWFSVPMGAGLFLTRHREILYDTFSIAADYMPKEASDLEITDPFMHSIQWSRRFIGLKFYLSLLMLGWKGLSEMIRYTTEIGNYLKQSLQDNGWKVMNPTPLPIACFVDRDNQQNSDFHFKLAKQIVTSGQAWISTYNIGDITTLRACITNYATTSKEIDDLVKSLNEKRSNL